MNLPEIAYVVAVLVVGILSYLLGYGASSYRERRAHRNLEMRLRQVNEWVRMNWPDKHAAWKQGHASGYQQGILQAEILREEDDAPTT